MNVMKIISAVMLITFAGSAIADGPQFTFTVPLSLVNLPIEVTGYRVACSVYQGPAPKGSGHTDGSISGGAFTGDVSVPITVTPPNNPALVDQYACSLQLRGTIDGTGFVFLDDSNTRFPLNSTAPFRHLIGPVPIPH